MLESSTLSISNPKWTAFTDPERLRMGHVDQHLYPVCGADSLHQDARGAIQHFPASGLVPAASFDSDADSILVKHQSASSLAGYRILPNSAQHNYPCRY